MKLGILTSFFIVKISLNIKESSIILILLNKKFIHNHINAITLTHKFSKLKKITVGINVFLSGDRFRATVVYDVHRLEVVLIYTRWLAEAGAENRRLEHLTCS